MAGLEIDRPEVEIAAVDVAIQSAFPPNLPAQSRKQHGSVPIGFSGNSNSFAHLPLRYNDCACTPPVCTPSPSQSSQTKVLLMLTVRQLRLHTRKDIGHIVFFLNQRIDFATQCTTSSLKIKERYQLMSSLEFCIRES